MKQNSHSQLEQAFLSTIKKNIGEKTWQWLENSTKDQSTHSISTAFSSISRKITKNLVQLSKLEEEKIAAIAPNLIISNWDNHLLCRVWLLMKINPEDKATYIKKVEAFFNYADINELISLYTALPLFAYPETWVKRCAEGLRSNIGSVLEAIMYSNSYPAAYLNEASWNQMILRALFTDKELNKIVGIDQRANLQLAESLFDYVQERWAANRVINIQLWRLVGRFVNESNFSIIQQLFNNSNKFNKKAAALVCSQSNYPPAQQLLSTDTNLNQEIKSGALNWVRLTEEYNLHKNS